MFREDDRFLELKKRKEKVFEQYLKQMERGRFIPSWDILDTMKDLNWIDQHLLDRGIYDDYEKHYKSKDRFLKSA